MLARVYQMAAPLNHFHAAGGMGFVVAELLESGFLMGAPAVGGLICMTMRASHFWWRRSRLRAAPKVSGDDGILRPSTDPHSVNGGLKMLDGNLSRR